MAISHELSSEIAAALFAAKERSPHELNDLKQMLLEIHSTLERLNHSILEQLNDDANPTELAMRAAAGKPTTDS